MASKIAKISKRIGSQSFEENQLWEPTLLDGLLTASDLPFDAASASDMTIARFLDRLSEHHPWRVAEALRLIAQQKGLTDTAQLKLDRLLTDTQR